MLRSVASPHECGGLCRHHCRIAMSSFARRCVLAAMIVLAGTGPHPTSSPRASAAPPPSVTPPPSAGQPASTERRAAPPELAVKKVVVHKDCPDGPVYVSPDGRRVAWRVDGD